MWAADLTGALAGLQRAIQSMEQGLAPIAPAGLQGFGGFGDLVQQVRQEADDFIAHGSVVSETVPGLRPEGWLRQQQVQGEQATTTPHLDPDRQHFVRTLTPLAGQAAAQLGVAPELLVAHAALESGWGQRPVRQPDGRDTHNLFGIKAGGAWQGDSATALTTEYTQGQPALQTARFRAYPDAASAFQDYAQLLRTPRYQGVIGTGHDARAFAQGLVRGGYATDPAYADKLVRMAHAVRAGQSRSERE